MQGPKKLGIALEMQALCTVSKIYYPFTGLTWDDVVVINMKPMMQSQQLTSR
jgi:hypothetical protein